MITPANRRLGVSRRSLLTAALISPFAARAATAPVLRLGVLQFGTVQWVAEIIRSHRLDQAHGFTLEMVTLANNDAGRVALMARSADVVVSDWFFVAAQRNAGTMLSFSPFTSAAGGVLVPATSPIRTLADLRGARLGVAGGPVDKAWLLLQATARAREGLDLATAAHPVYGAPPLLNAKLQQGELDAVLTFWNFAARLEAQGFRQVISVAEAARALDLPSKLSLIGFVFHEAWAQRDPALLSGFLAAAAAEQMLAQNPQAWTPIRPLMEAPEPALFTRLRDRFIDGIDHPSQAEQLHAAEHLFDILLKTGGTRATADMTRLPDGVFWPTS